MDPVTMTVLFKGIGLILALVFGFVVAVFGFILFRNGAGHGRDKTALEIGPIKIKAYSVGSFIMATAVAWAWLGVSISPNLKKSGDDIEVYSFKIDGIDATVPSFSMLIPLDTTDSFLRDESYLTSIFTAGFEQNTVAGRVRLNGKMPVFFPDSIQAVQSDGTFQLSTMFEGDGKNTLVYFQPNYVDGVVTFTPFEVTRPPE